MILALATETWLIETSKTPKKIDNSRNSNSLLSQNYRVLFSHRDINQTFFFSRGIPGFKNVDFSLYIEVVVVQILQKC